MKVEIEYYIKRKDDGVCMEIRRTVITDEEIIGLAIDKAKLPPKYNSKDYELYNFGIKQIDEVKL